MGRNSKSAVARRVDKMPSGLASRQNRMKNLPRIVLAEPVIHGVLKIVWNDGYEGIVDLRPTIARGRIFTHLQNARNFSKVRVSEYGHSVEWTDDDGDQIDPHLHCGDDGTCAEPDAPMAHGAARPPGERSQRRDVGLAVRARQAPPAASSRAGRLPRPSRPAPRRCRRAA